MAKLSFITPQDPNRSTVLVELDAMDWEFCELARLLGDIERISDPSTRAFNVATAKRRLDTLYQRCFRAKQIARGIRVPRAN